MSYLAFLLRWGHKDIVLHWHCQHAHLLNWEGISCNERWLFPYCQLNSPVPNRGAAIKVSVVFAGVLLLWWLNCLFSVWQFSGLLKWWWMFPVAISFHRVFSIMYVFINRDNFEMFKLFLNNRPLFAFYPCRLFHGFNHFAKVWPFTLPLHHQTEHSLSPESSLQFNILIVEVFTWFYFVAILQCWESREALQWMNSSDPSDYYSPYRTLPSNLTRVCL